MEQPPLLLPVLRWVPRELLPLVFILLDVYIAWVLFRLAESRLQEQKREVWPAPVHAKANDTPKDRSLTVPEKALKQDDTQPSPVFVDPSLVQILYLMNPYSLLSCVGMSTGLFVNAAVVTCIWLAVQSTHFCQVS
jgi:phosphatidylinositol glycan class U